MNKMIKLMCWLCCIFEFGVYSHCLDKWGVYINAHLPEMQKTIPYHYLDITDQQMKVLCRDHFKGVCYVPGSMHKNNFNSMVYVLQCHNQKYICVFKFLENSRNTYVDCLQISQKKIIERRRLDCCEQLQFKLDL